jgi:hypothetical protein
MRTLTKFVPALALLCGLATLHADTGTTDPTTKPNGNGNGSGNGTGVDVAVTTNLSVSEMRIRIVGIQSQITDDARHVMFYKEQAKKQKDVIKLTCVNDKIVQLKAQQNIADTTADQLQVALNKNSDERNGLFGQFASTAEAIKRLREEAGGCIGIGELYKQESGNNFFHPDFPDDPNQRFPLGWEIEPPGYCSPYD